MWIDMCMYVMLYVGVWCFVVWYMGLYIICISCGKYMVGCVYELVYMGKNDCCLCEREKKK